MFGLLQGSTNLAESLFYLRRLVSLIVTQLRSNGVENSVTDATFEFGDVIG